MGMKGYLSMQLNFTVVMPPTCPGRSEDLDSLGFEQFCSLGRVEFIPHVMACLQFGDERWLDELLVGDNYLISCLMEEEITVRQRISVP
jgi:hypothetical protein